MSSQSATVRPPVWWVPSSYFAEGIPFAMVIWVAGTMFKDLGHSDGEITLATASVGLAWSLKPFWAAFLDRYKTKKFFVLLMEFTMAALLAAVALALPLPNYFQVTIAILWVLAFASATQDICVDGVYITSLDKARQAAWIGLQGAAWVTGRIFATALVVWVAGSLQRGGHDPKQAWAYALGLSVITMAALGVYHYFMLPTGSVAAKEGPAETVNTPTHTRVLAGLGVGIGLGLVLMYSTSNITLSIGIGGLVALAFIIGWKDHWPPIKAFFRKPQIWGMLLFVFLYRSGEGFLLVEAPLFMQAPLDQGGLGLTLEQKGAIDGLISTLVSLGGGIAGGAFISKFGLKKTLVFMALCMNIPHVCYVILSQAVSPEAPLSMTTISLLVTLEKFGYSFGFVANMLYMMQQISPGKYHMTHYAFCTALMNLVLVPTQMASGPLADWMGYKNFFLFVMIASIPSVIAAWLAPFPNTPSSGSEVAEGSPDQEREAAPSPAA